MTIKHLVLPGGSINGVQTLGILSHLSLQHFFELDDIESIDATSVGSFLAILIALKFEWSYMIDYILLRRWHETVEFTLNTMLCMVTEKGFYNHKFYEMFFKPFFDARNISLDITMQEFHELTKIELHFYTVNINEFAITDLNSVDFPDLPLLTAVQMTSALPVLITPVFYKDSYYIDGAFGVNYPLYICLRRAGINEDEVLGIYNEIKGGVNNEEGLPIASTTPPTKEKSSTDYFLFFCNQLLRNTKLKTEDKRCYIKNEIVCYVNSFTVDSLQKLTTDQEFRKELLEKGIDTAEQFLKKQMVDTA